MNKQAGDPIQALQEQRQEDKAEINRLNKVTQAMAVLFIKKYPRIMGADTLQNKVKQLIKVCEKDAKGCPNKNTIEDIKYLWNLR